MFEPKKRFRGKVPKTLSPDEIRAIGRRLGFDLPDDYVAAASQYGCYSFDDDHGYIRYEYGRPPPVKSVLTLETLLHFDEDVLLWSVQDVLTELQHTATELEKELSQGLLPFATADEHGCLCLDFRTNKEQPSVVFYGVDNTPGTEISPLADSFDEFLQKCTNRRQAVGNWVEGM